MNLNQKVIALLKSKKLKISIAESCTGGLLSSAITSVNGSSKVFSMGLVTYSNQAKISVLKVHKNIIQKGYERLIDKNSMGSLFKILIVSK